MLPAAIRQNEAPPQPKKKVSKGSHSLLINVFKPLPMELEFSCLNKLQQFHKARKKRPAPHALNNPPHVNRSYFLTDPC